MSRKPRILMIGDVVGWAWDIKTKILQKYLSDEFELINLPILENRDKEVDKNSYDLYFTYGWAMVHYISSVPWDRRISGVTAHKQPDYFRGTIIPRLKEARWLHANSMMLFNEVVEAGLKNVYYVPNGVDENQFRVIVPIREKADNLVVGHVGKRCGSGTDAKGHKRFIEPACQKAGVIYRGHYNNYKDRIAHEKMVNIYQEIDCFIVSSETDGTPNGALEAAACGRPIISNKIGNMPEFIKEGYNGFLVKRSVDEYVKKLILLKENRELLRSMGANARKEIEQNWTWKKMAENYREMFREIINHVGIRG